MKKLEWVVDTWVLHKATIPDETGLEAIALLTSILHKHAIGMDHEGLIEQEYHPLIFPKTWTFVAQWWSQMIRRADKTFHQSGNLAKAHENRLLNQLNFDRADLPFVSVAAKSADRILVSEDSDYNQRVKDYLLKALGVDVLPLDKALEKAEDP